MESCYLQAIKQCPITVGTPPNCSILYWDYMASINEKYVKGFCRGEGSELLQNGVM